MTVQVTFRHMKASPALERQIRARAAWLETFYPGIISCRVVVEIPHRHQERGRPVDVRIEVSLPGEDIVVSHEPMLEDAFTVIHDAFDVARRRLEDAARLQRGAVKAHQVV